MLANVDSRKHRRYGLIGHPLGHSLSPFIHHAILEALETEGSYEIFEIRPDEFDGLLPRIFRQLDGFNVTIPYKERILPHLRDCHASASRYGAVNTVREGIGYNTDGEGFLSCGIGMSGRRVLLLGAGGVSRMMGFEAALAGAASVRILSRGVEKARRLAQDIATATGHEHVTAVESTSPSGHPEVILNGTPLGMWPRVRGTPVPREVASAAVEIFDSIYNPPATRLLLHGKSGGARIQGGLAMLFGQAVAAQRIWNPGLDWDDPDLKLRLAKIPPMLSRELVRRDTVKYLLTGFMGSGKSSVGKAVASGIGLPFIDMDVLISERAGKSIPAMFTEDGEPAFRILEAGILKELLELPGSAIIATGGGALLGPDAMKIVEATPSIVILLDTGLDQILKRVGRNSGRPLLDGDDKRKAEQLYRERLPAYVDRADLVVGNNKHETIAGVAGKIVEALGF